MKYFSLLCLTLCVLACGATFSLASNADTQPDSVRPVTIAVLPFVMHTTETDSHIQKGVVTMLNTRLAWPDQVRVVPGQKITTVLNQLDTDNRNQMIEKVAEQTDSRYVLDGSITQLAGSFSIDAVVYDILNKQHMTFFEQSDNSDELIDKISRIAANINKEVFDRTTTDWEKIEQERQARRNELRRQNPEHLMQNPQWQPTRESPGWKIWKYLF
jgi:TolB-like protein